MEFVVDSCEEGLRLDQVLVRRFKADSRAYFQGLISRGLVHLNGRDAKKSAKVEAGDEIEVEFALTPELSLEPEPIPLNIVYEDDAIIVVNKPADLVVHPGVGNWSGTFVNGLLYHCKQLAGGDSLRPGIVHRLDKGTTGVLIAAKTDKAHAHLTAQFAARTTHKEYLAIGVGRAGNQTITLPIGRDVTDRKRYAPSSAGKEAITHVKTLTCEGNYTLVRCTIETGRTHQIRVHLKAIGCPVYGDPMYGCKPHSRQMLHAETLTVDHPLTGERLTFTAPMAQDMAHLCARLFKESHTVK